MTSSRFSDESIDPVEERTACFQCGGPLAWRPERPYPTFVHFAFGASFAAFLICFDSVRRLSPQFLWIWSAAQIALGVVLIQLRLQAKKRVLRCIRCKAGIT